MSELNTLMGIRTTFSLGESIVSSEKVVDIAVRLGQTHVVVADTMRIDSLIDVTKAAKKADIEAHVGVRLRIVARSTDPLDPPGSLLRDKKIKNKNAYYIKVFPKDDIGLRQIFKLVSRGYQADRFFYVSRLSLDDVFEFITPDHCVITTGDSESIFTQPDGQALFDRLVDEFRPDSLFVEIIPIAMPYFERQNVEAIRAHRRTPGTQLLVTSPVLFDDGGYEAWHMSMSIQNRHDFKRGFFNSPWWKEFTPKTPHETIAQVKATFPGMVLLDPALSTEGDLWSVGFTQGNPAFLAATAYRWSKAPIALPKLSANPDQAILDLCKTGIPARLGTEVFGYKPTPQQISEVYVPRLKYELGVLRDLKFADYFLVVADLVNWAKSQNIMVGPGRGSVGGSLHRSCAWPATGLAIGSR